MKNERESLAGGCVAPVCSLLATSPGIRGRRRYGDLVHVGSLSLNVARFALVLGLFSVIRRLHVVAALCRILPWGSSGLKCADGG